MSLQVYSSDAIEANRKERERRARARAQERKEMGLDDEGDRSGSESEGSFM